MRGAGSSSPTKWSKLMNQPNVSGACPRPWWMSWWGRFPCGPDRNDGPGQEPAPNSVPARTEAQPASGAQTAPVAAPAAKVALTPVATLNKKPKNHYSIQLMGASNTKAVDSFVAEHGLAGKVWVYKTRFRGSPWYVVVQGRLRQQCPGQGGHSQAVACLAQGTTLAQVIRPDTKELKQ